MIADGLRILELSALASSTAILFVLLLRKPMRARLGAQAAYVLWLLVPVAAAVVLLPAPVASKALAVLPAVVGQMTMSPVVGASSEVQFDPAPWLVGAWLLGLGSCALLLFWQQRRFVRALGRLSMVGDRIVRAEATAGCPALVGAWHPRVVLPADFERRYSAAERELILAHERAHCARGDAQLNVFAALLRCLFWFNPLVYIAVSRFRFDQELACDAAVIARFPEARRPYADAMLKTQLADIGLPAGCYWQSSHPLKERISMLKQPLPGRARAALGLAIAAALIAGGTYVAWAAQPAAVPTAAKSADTTGQHAMYRKLYPVDYPAAAVAAKMEGVVYVRVHIAVDGSVAAASLDHVDPPAATLLAGVAVAGIKDWTFIPAKSQGKPVESDETVPVAFSLDPKRHPKVEGTVFDAIVISPREADSVATSDVPASEDVTFRKSAPPKYPQAAINAHQSGKVVLKVRVDEHGNPESANVVKADPPESEKIFADASIAAVMQWKFNPKVEGGKQVAGEILVPITYAFGDDD